MPIRREDELRHVNLDPATHRTPEWLERREAWRTTVRRRLVERVGGVG